MKALEVLNDCKTANWELSEALQQGNQDLIRIRWITCLNLLRMVGHVLENIDKENYPTKKLEFKQIFEAKKKEPIFRDFIKKERDLALKQYQTKITKDKLEFEENVAIITEDGHFLVTEKGERIVTGQTETITHHASKLDSKDKEKRLDVWIEAAIDWWEEYIEELKEKINDT